MPAIPTTPVAECVGFRASHYAAMASLGLSDEEIQKDWEQVERDLDALREEDLGVIA
jgi:hypothetical protein